MPPDPEDKDTASAGDKKKPAHSFDTDEDFLKAAGKRFDGKVKAAEKAAADKVLADVCQLLGVEDKDQIAEIKTKLDAAAGTLTEAEKHKSEATRLSREHKKLSEENSALRVFKHEVLKDRAISPHLNKVHPDFRTLVRKNIIGDLAIGEGDKVASPDGKEAEALIDELIKATPSLKAPDFKDGAGTKPTGKSDSKASGDKPQPDQTHNPDQNGTPVSLGSALAEVLKAQAGISSGT